MNKSLQSVHTIHINASSKKLWKVLTDASKIALYLYGTKTETDWKVGSPITFSGEINNMQYSDKGIVIANIPGKLLVYDYWTQFSGLEDKPENYSEVAYQIEEHHNGGVNFTWQQIGFKNEDALKHNNSGLPSLLEQIKKIAEE